MRRVMLILLGLSGSVIVAAILCENVICTVRRDERAAVAFPCDADTMGLQVMEMRSYTGPFVEDGSRREVCDVAAIVVYNGGDRLLECGAVKLQQGERVLVFSFTMIPPGARVLVLECSAKSYSEERVSSCWSWSLPGRSDERIRVEEAGRTALAFTNLSEQTLNSATVWFKDYDPEEKMLIGGISYCVKVRSLEPGHRLVIPVFQYISGKSMLVG